MGCTILWWRGNENDQELALTLCTDAEAQTVFPDHILRSRKRMAARRATDYINACADALEVGIDFTPRNVHSGQHWPLAKQQRKYVRENLTWIDGVGLAEKKTL